jgi:alpha-tubulin suppressor-like RCC1 family protein
VPVTLPAGAPTGFAFTSVSAWVHSCGIGNNGRAYCWGGNLSGQLGDGTTTNRLTPVPVYLPADVTGFTSVRAGSEHSCGIGNNGRAYCWGWNGNGVLGNGSTTRSSTPVPVTLPAGAPTGFAFTSVSAGWEHNCRIGNNGRAYCWGSNGNGRLGDSTTTNRLTPVPVTLPAGAPTGFAFTSVSTARYHSCGMGNNGRAYCWGWNNRSQLGDGTNTDRLTPVPVSLPADVTSFTSVSTAGYHSCGTVP